MTLRQIFAELFGGKWKACKQKGWHGVWWVQTKEPYRTIRYARRKFRLYPDVRLHPDDPGKDITNIVGPKLRKMGKPLQRKGQQ